MSDKKRSRAIYWLLFFVSVAAFFGVYAIGGGYCSMGICYRWWLLLNGIAI